MPFVFISYRTSDEAFAANLIEIKLRERLGAGKVFLDNRSIGIGRDFKPELWGALAKCDVLLAVIGPGWRGARDDGTTRIGDPADFVHQEIELALRIGILVVPVLVGDVPSLRAADLPEDLRPLADRQYTRLRSRGAEHDVARLVEEIARLDGHAAAERPGTVAVIRLAGSGVAADLRDPLAEATTDSGLSHVTTTETPAGASLSFPLSTQPVKVAGAFVTALDAALRGRPGGPRVKVAVADAAPEASALAHAPVLDEVLSHAVGARVVLAVPPSFFETAVRPHPRQIDPSTFAEASLGGSGETCWIHVPGYSAPPKVAGLGPRRDRPTADPRAGFANYGTIVSGNSFGGDYVAGDKHVRTDGGAR